LASALRRKPYYPVEESELYLYLLRSGAWEMEQSLRYILPAYLALYFFTAFFWRSYRVWKTKGVNPFVLGSSDSAHDYIGKLFRLLFALIVMTVILYVASSSAYEYLMPISWLQHSTFKIIGLILLLCSLVWTLLARAQMGSSWRIGIDTKRQTELVHTGIFRLSRNPIFLGMIVTLMGLLLVIPNALTLLILALGFVLIQIQVRLEEEYLSKAHGRKYTEYQRDVRRWL
jgi:protein-S-isoprenylcysteine O-methyltransferase Ste14